MAFEELKQRQSVMWGQGPYQRITETLGDIHERVIEALSPGDGDRWLDLATGTGGRRACRSRRSSRDRARSRAHSDRDGQGARRESRPRDRIRRRRRRAASVRGRQLRQSLVDARDHVLALPRGRRARARPRHGARRPCRTRELDAYDRLREDVQGDGAVSAGATPEQPLPWGDEAHVRELLGDAFDLELEEHVSTFRVPSGEAYWELFSTSYGPTKVLADTLGDRREELHRDWVDSSRRTTARTARSSTRASICSCAGGAGEQPPLDAIQKRCCLG
jgi:hypothetical protein